MSAPGSTRSTPSLAGFLGYLTGTTICLSFLRYHVVLASAGMMAALFVGAEAVDRATAWQGAADGLPYIISSLALLVLYGPVGTPLLLRETSPASTMTPVIRQR